MKKEIHRGMILGVFDGFHPGHQFFLKSAAEQCEELVVVVTLSEVAQAIKGRLPKNSFDERCRKIKEFNIGTECSLEVVSGDALNGEWAVLRNHIPDKVFLGYDQQGIARELDRLAIPCSFIGAHHPEKYKSSMLL